MTAAGARTVPPTRKMLRTHAYEMLEELIVTHALEPGASVTEDLLAQRTGIGRTPIREALQRLARDGLVSIRPRSAIVILEMTHARQLQLLEARAALQEQTVRLAARRADVGEVVPATGGQLGEADGRVDVWLRNGSELRGTWADPHLAMSIRVGGADVPVDLPMNDLSRFQLQGDARWPGGPIYRM